MGILTLAIYSIPKSAESLRWRTADGYDCEDTGMNTYTCCKNITVVIGGVTLSANRCVDCEYGREGGVTCGDAYHVAVSSVNPGEPVDPKALDLIGKGLAALNDRTEKGGQVDPKSMNSAKALIGKSLTILTKGETKEGTVDPKVTKNASLLIDRILSADKMIKEYAQKVKVPKTGALDDAPVLKENGTGDTINQTKVPKNPGGINNGQPTLSPNE